MKKLVLLFTPVLGLLVIVSIGWYFRNQLNTAYLCHKSPDIYRKSLERPDVFEQNSYRSDRVESFIFTEDLAEVSKSAMSAEYSEKSRMEIAVSGLRQIMGEKYECLDLVQLYIGKEIDQDVYNEVNLLYPIPQPSLIEGKDGFQDLATDDFSDIESHITKLIQNNRTNEAVDAALKYGEKILYALDFQPTGNPGEQERYKEHSRKVTRRYYEYLKTIATSSPALHSDFRFSEKIFKFASSQGDTETRDNAMNIIEARHKKEIGDQIYCLQAESMDYSNGEVNTKLEKVALKCPDDSIAKMVMTFYITAISEKQGKKAVKRAVELAKKRFPNLYIPD